MSQFILEKKPRIPGGMDGEISGFLGRVGSEFLGIPLGEGAFKTELTAKQNKSDNHFLS